MRRLIYALLLGAALQGCAVFALFQAPKAPVAEPVPEAVLNASAAVGLASATANVRLTLTAPQAARTLERQGVTPDVPVERVVSRATRPGSTRQVIAATAGPAVERTVITRPGPETPVRSGAQGRDADSGAVERWAIPVENPRVTSRFGPRIDPITRQPGRMHRGVDFGGPTGTPIYAAASGRVVLGGYCDRGTGNCVVIDHVGGWRSQYFHMSSVDVRPNQVVRQGDRIGTIGSTGRSTGPHLHFQVGRAGEAVDPEGLFGRPVR